MAEEKIEEKYRQYHMIQQQLEQIAEFTQQLQQQRQEIETSIEALKELQETKTGTEVLAPVANGIFMKAELKDNQRLTVNIGADVIAEKTIPEIITLLEEQKEKIGENISQAEEVVQQLQERRMKIYQEVNSE